MGSTQERLSAAFDYMVERDPFSGHVVIRTTDSATAGSTYRLWTTLKTPQGFSIEKHAALPRGGGWCEELAADAGEAAVHARRRAYAAP